MLLSAPTAPGSVTGIANEMQGLSPTHCHLLHARRVRHFWEGKGLLSVKSFFSGRAHYSVGRGHYAVDDSCYLVLNDGQQLQAARRLLVQTDRSVTDICFAVGFASHGSFSWLFRRRFGISPMAYRVQKT